MKPTVLVNGDMIFRPSYLEIIKIRSLLPTVPLLALTATATPEVVKDIQALLGFAAENVFRMSFERKNLSYVLRTTQEKFYEMLHILQSVEGSAIVYCQSRRRTKEAAEFLIKKWSICNVVSCRVGKYR